MCMLCRDWVKRVGWRVRCAHAPNADAPVEDERDAAHPRWAVGHERFHGLVPKECQPEV